MNKITSIVTTLAVICGIAAIWTIKSNAEQKSMRDILPLPPAITSAETGKSVPTESLRGKFVALYFSASWCIPCKKFTPKLAKFREANKDKNFEVVFMSLDSNAAEKNAYMKKEGMKWLTAPGQASKEINHIMDFYKLEGVPSVIVFGPNGELITTDGRGDVTDDPADALTKWKASINPNS